ncbi:MAG: extracellular solute-binding protein [Desulfobacterales bacterium]
MSTRFLTPIYILILLSVLFTPPTCASEPGHAYSYFGELKYAKDFPHFDYVNPDAPKGGRLREAKIGTFNNLHPWVDKGVSAADIQLLIYDTFMKTSDDELWSEYCYLCETVEVADDFSWVEYKLREGPYWHDGVPMTVEDVLWTFNTLKTEGALGWKNAYKNVLSIEQTGPRSVRFHLSKSEVKTIETAMLLTGISPLPKHYWKDKTFNATTLDPPLGSGPYRIKKVDPGHKIVYERVENFWGKDLPVNVGFFNFGTIEYVYFLDKYVAIQALKKGLYDYRWEPSAKDFAISYDFDGYDKGLFTKLTDQLDLPFGMYWGIIFNTRSEKLADIRVREALTLAFNWDWSNRVLGYDSMERVTSYFTGSAVAATGLPSAAEETILEPFRDQIPPRVFTHEVGLPGNDPHHRNRNTLMRAAALLQKAGWVVRDFKRVNEKTGEAFTLDFLADSVDEERTFIPYADNLKRLGITSRIRRVETSQSINRMRKYDFEVASVGYWQDAVPYSWLLRGRFQTINADRHNMSNFAGIRVPAIDILVERVIAADTKEDMVAAGRALDRILLWNFYMIPGDHPPGLRSVYWNRFGSPPPYPERRYPSYPLHWWFDEEKSAQVDAGIAELVE